MVMTTLDKLKEGLNDLIVEAREDAERQNRTIISCLSSALRPYLELYLDPTSGKLAPDKRSRKWAVEITFWDITEGKGAADLVGECCKEVVTGFDGVWELIQEMVEGMYEEVEKAEHITIFGTVSLKRRLGGLRPSLSRGGGRATLRLTYAVPGDKWHLCTVLVTHPEDKACAT